ncbi:MAG: Sec-independent protein translocase protein TatC [Phycisphaeraceae bacterium]|nr:MAG: Sec-independent protein translocase protein TatC [Phycisphaeraceae bacterium]
MSFGDHLDELRKRLIWAVLPLIPLLVTAFFLGRPILYALIAPAREKLAAHGQVPRLLATAPFETFGTVIHIALVVTVLVGAPWLLYQLWRFIAPGLYVHERRFVRILVPMSGVLAMVGVLFLYFVILPVILNFFIVFSNDIGGSRVDQAAPPPETLFVKVPVLAADPVAPEVGDAWVNSSINQWRVCLGVDADGVPKISGTELIGQAGIVQQYRVSEYIKTFLNMALGFGAGFQMPVVVLLLGWLGIVEPKDFGRFRKHICAACFVASAVLTPADPLSMLLLAVPLYALFEFGVLLLRILPAERVIGSAREPADAGDA